MQPGEIFAIIIISIIIGLALFFIIKNKKSGNKCIGCPYSKSCKSKNFKCNNKDIAE